MILKLGMDHQGLKVYRVYINDDFGLNLTNFTARSSLVCLYQTNSQVSVYRTIGPLVVIIAPKPYYYQNNTNIPVIFKCILRVNLIKFSIKVTYITQKVVCILT